MLILRWSKDHRPSCLHSAALRKFTILPVDLEDADVKSVQVIGKVEHDFTEQLDGFYGNETACCVTGRVLMNYPHCTCFDQYTANLGSETRFHSERQDTQCDGWKRLLELIEQAVVDGREEFAPAREIPYDQWTEVLTLPTTIGRLKGVKRLVLYASWLVRIPPEIGEMENLEKFEPYTSHRLHWFPYEITRCKKLKNSTVSTRSLYGNYKFRPSFPRLRPASLVAADLDLQHLSPGAFGVEAATDCSVCGASVASGGLHQAWLSAVVATDVLPLLVNACSETCIGRLPRGADGYVKEPHAGGVEVVQPPPDH